MTMTPDERAQQVFDKIIEGDSYDKNGSADVPALIAAAIREAENEALEFAAKLLGAVEDGLSENTPAGPVKDCAIASRSALDRAATLIRALKHKD